LGKIREEKQKHHPQIKQIVFRILGAITLSFGRNLRNLHSKPTTSCFRSKILLE
jgi:hypothetical protein